ncbi:hypothetical protein PTKIN_Ptkin08bG0011900 [Pterospermum kingtungense]
MKLKRLKATLRMFNKEKFSDISERVQEKRQELACLQTEMLNLKDPGDLVDNEKVLMIEFRTLS